MLSLLGGSNKRITALPLAGGWTKYRDLPAPEGQTFTKAWAARLAKRQGA